MESSSESTSRETTPESEASDEENDDNDEDEEEVAQQDDEDEDKLPDMEMVPAKPIVHRDTAQLAEDYTKFFPEYATPEVRRCTKN